MTSPQLGEWCAHVTYADGHLVEVVVESASGNKHIAVHKVLKELNLSGVNDPAIKNINIKEISIPNSKTHSFGDSNKMETPPQPVSAPEYEYVVQLYVSPHVTTVRKWTITAVSALVALKAAATACGVKEIGLLGPYCVQERIPKRDKNGLLYTLLVTRLIKTAVMFPGVGPVITGGSYDQPAVTIAPRPVVGAAQARPVATKDDRREQYISDVIDILSKETKVDRKKYNIKQD